MEIQKLKIKPFNKKKFNSFFLLFSLFIFFTGTFWLYQKHLIGNDSTISEWLINYQGGFTRRGIIGEICFRIADYFDLKLRFVIFLFQATISLTYIILLYQFIKNLPRNALTVVAIFSPIFLLYPLGEIEVLLRKETFLFIGFIPFVIFILFIQKNEQSFKKKIFKIITCLSSSFFTITYIILNPLSSDQHVIMSNGLIDRFGEVCYMSCGLLKNKSSIEAQFMDVFDKITFTAIFRYFLVMLIGFFPLIILTYNSSFKKKILFLDKFKNLLIPFLIILILPILLFSAMTDWVRVVNITYTFSILTYLFLLKNDLININQKVLYFDHLYVHKKKLFIILFYLFAFSWNPKTQITGDIATNTLYKIIYNSSKKIFGFQGTRLFEGSLLIEFHKKYFE